MLLQILNNPIFINILCMSFILFIILYIWKKVCNIENNLYILEKRVNNIKKNTVDGNKHLNENILAADIIMNEVFGNVCSSVGCNDFKYKEPKEPKEHKEHKEPKIELNKNTSFIEIINLPVAEHIAKESPINLDLSSSTSNIPDIMSDIVSECTSIDNVISDTDDIIKYITTSGKKLLKLDIPTLKDYCTKLNISSEGTKNQIIERLLIRSSQTQ